MTCRLYSCLTWHCLPQQGECEETSALLPLPVSRSPCLLQLSSGLSGCIMANHVMSLLNPQVSVSEHLSPPAPAAEKVFPSISQSIRQSVSHNKTISQWVFIFLLLLSSLRCFAAVIVYPFRWFLKRVHICLQHTLKYVLTCSNQV